MSKTCQLNRPIAVDLITGPSYPWTSTNAGPVWARGAYTHPFGSSWSSSPSETPFAWNCSPVAAHYAAAISTFYTMTRLTRLNPFRYMEPPYDIHHINGCELYRAQFSYYPWPPTPGYPDELLIRQDTLEPDRLYTLWFPTDAPNPLLLYSYGTSAAEKGGNMYYTDALAVTVEPEP